MIAYSSGALGACEPGSGETAALERGSAEDPGGGTAADGDRRAADGDREAKRPVTKSRRRGERRRAQNEPIMLCATRRENQ
jgi:hypothetical protein